MGAARSCDSQPECGQRGWRGEVRKGEACPQGPCGSLSMASALNKEGAVGGS